MKVLKHRKSTFFTISLMALFLCFTFSCTKENTFSNAQKSVLVIPAGFPDVNFPDDNAFTQKRWELGKKLFFDPILSLDSSISCSSCHKPALAFADDKTTSPGIKNRAGKRNSPTLANVAYHPYFLKEGGVPTLEMQILVPIQEHNEFNHNIVDIAEQLAKKPEYVPLSQEAYSRNSTPFVITRAIATFERSLISGNSFYDQYLNGNTSALSLAALRGKDLFFGAKTNCSSCHGGFDFTDYSFKNNGLDSVYTDIGRMRFTNDSADLSLFKVPTVRNVEFTAPYMHNGQFLTLEEVVEHYNSGGFNHPNKSNLLKPLNLSESEKTDLVEFLKSLTDFGFINNENWK